MNSYKCLVITTLTLLISLSLLPTGRGALSQSQQISNGVNYLKATQSADGSWGGTATSLNGVFPTTAAALEALRTVEATTSPNQTNAIQFLTAQAVAETPYLAARVIALSGTGNSLPADVDTLIARQNADGGWGTAEGFESDVLDTAQALVALKAANVSNTTALTGALSYLIGRQNTDGGWALTTREDSQVFYTALALQALNSCHLQFAVSLNQTRAVTYLRSRQNADGGYGSPASTPFETALSLLAIFGAGQPLMPVEAGAINYLNSAQQVNGSWANDAYSTALALRALAFPRDTDADGMPDSFETANGLNPNDPTDANTDSDSDGLTNLEEFRRSTNPNNGDTDGDGVDDQTEVFSGNPLDPTSKNRPPVITSQPVTTASEGQPYSYQVQVSDPDNDALSFTLLQLPAGMSMSQTGLIQWTPASDQAGSFTVIVKASDGRGGQALQQYRVRVLAKGVDLAVSGVDASAVTTNQQTLVASGIVQVAIENRGGSLFDGQFELLLFEDRNGDGTYQNGTDNVLGSGTFAGSIASSSMVPLGVPVSGVVLFRDNLVYAFVDSAGQIPELDETNNIGSSGRESKYQPPVNDFQPKVKWSYDMRTANGITAAPVIAPLIDTNGDQLVNERDVPAVIFMPPSRSGQLTALRGDTGAVIFDTTETSVDFFENITPAVGDLDGDGEPEIVVGAFVRPSGRLVCLNNNGTLRWTSQVVPFDTNPTITDLDGDGRAEILFGISAFNFDGTLRWNRSQLPNRIGGSGSGAQSPGAQQVADLDLDGVPEIIAGPSAFDRNGNRIWIWETFFNGVNFTVRGTLDRGQTSITFDSNFILVEAFTAVANLDDDPHPEVIVVSDNAASGTGNFSDTLWIFEHDGRLKTNPAIGLYQEVGTQLYWLGPPTVADFDGDGEPEIAIPATKDVRNQFDVNNFSQAMLAVYERDGSLKWRRDLIPNTFSFTRPASAFDFDGDGAAEIVYLDDQKLYILNGRDGATLYELGVGHNCCATAYPASPTWTMTASPTSSCRRIRFRTARRRAMVS